MKASYLITAAVVGTVLALLLFLFSAVPLLFFLLFVVACLAPLSLVFLLLLFYRKMRHLSAALLVLILVFLVTGIICLRYQATLRPTLRWAFFAHRYKAQVMAQPSRPSDEFRHVEWDGWGGAPVGDWTAYVVFDPTDSLDTAAHQTPEKIPGVPCDVLEVRRLEEHWYSVTLGVNEWWEQCKLDNVRRAIPR